MTAPVTAPGMAPGMAPVEREVLLITNTGRDAALAVARWVARRFLEAGLGVRMLADEAALLGVDGVRVHPCPPAHGLLPGDPGPAVGAELVLVLGGDGSLLRAADFARPVGVPLLGVNLGHVGFLAEAEPEELAVTVDRVMDRDYAVEDRMTIDTIVRVDGEIAAEGWALNEAALEKDDRTRMLECVAEIDGRPLMQWACDGVLVATPTGSTAYAFSTGGPIVWPDVEAMLLMAISAHALFARPVVVSPHSRVAVEVLSAQSAAVLFCDGRRTVPVPPGGRVEVSRGRLPVRLVRLQGAPFADRLVRKFELPVHSWRGRPHGSDPTPA